MKPAWLLIINLFLFAVLGCATSVTDAIVDNEVKKILAEENKKLPQDLGNGIELTSVTYAAENNRLTLNYRVEDPAGFRQHLDKVKFETKKRTRNNGGLQRALANNIQVFHDFKASSDGHTLESFETPKE